MEANLSALQRHIRKPGILHSCVSTLLRRRGQSMFDRFESFLLDSHTILDVGAGSCHVSEILQAKDYTAVPLDVSDLSLVKGIRPTLYDGWGMPFADTAFDVALVLFTLHHCPDPTRVLEEAARVSRRIVIMEDVPRNSLHKYVTWGMDNLLNLEFNGNPHNNKSDLEWRTLFQKMGLNLLAVSQHWGYGTMWQLTYYLES